jgi:outer membrane protein OmpA-like peptidoglycan-associated protein
MSRSCRPAAAALSLLLLGAGTAAAQEVSGNVLPLTYPILDLVYRVEDLTAQVRKLKLKETVTEMRIELPADILFDFDKADIRPTAAEALQQAAAILRERARGKVRIEGHTDSKGTHAYNQKLSERRAESVRRWLAEHEGLDKVKFATEGLAETRPVADNTNPDNSDNPEGRQQNRRVEIVISKK